jgi:carboxypeptidase family protein/TonB-dependent receptor-like protein
MKMGKMLAYGLALLACLYVFAPAATAQYRASIQGTVTDPQGATVAAATVTLQNEETGQTYKAETNENGIYNFNALPPSKFTVTVEKTGFKTKVIKGVGVISEQANNLNLVLEVGTATESVTVSGDSTPLIDTETANLQGTVNSRQIQSLPSFGRDPFQLLQLAPGAFGDGAQAAGGGTNSLPSSSMAGSGATDGIFKIENGGQVTANGARVGSNNYQIDGVGTTSVTWGGSSVITPNEDSIKEVKIVTDNYDAENGRYSGAQVQIISQNGTNNYHGSFFFKAHRPGLNAYQKYNGYANAVTRDNNRFNDWGGTIGGPILKNRLFVFFSYETLDNNAAGTTSSGWYETSQLRDSAAPGTNAAAFYNFPGAGPNGGSQTDTLNGQTLDCANVGLVEGPNCHFIAGQGLDIGSPLTSPLGTHDATFQSNSNPGVGNGLDGVADIAFVQNILNPSTSSHKQYNGRIDFNLTKKDLIAFSMYYVPNTSHGLNGNGSRLMNTFNSDYTNRAATVFWDHTFAPTLVNEVRVNAAGWMEKDLASNPDAPWGLPQIGSFAVGGIAVQGLGVGSFNGFDQWTYAAKDVLTKVHGAHTLKMGAEFTRLLSVDAPFWSDRPGYTFNNIWDFLNDAPISENGQFDPVTGVPSALRKDLRSTIVGAFFQDNWKIKPNLTLTAGLRWEYFGPVSEKNGNLATVQFGSGSNFFTDMSLRTGGGQYEAQKTNFGPQLGFAWTPRSIGGADLEGKLVLRGGFGMAYNGVVQSNTLDVRFNPPFVSNSQTLTGSNILYINSFPADVHDPNGYASNPATIQTFDSNNLPTKCCVDLTGLPAVWPTTYTYHYTLGSEYDLGHQWVAAFGYQGSSTRHLTQHYNLYNVGAVSGLAFNPVVHGVTYYADDGSAHFNALLTELRHNFSQSFQLSAQYRLSHGVDSGSNAYAGPFYQWNLATGFATSDYDVLHAFKVYGVWSPTIFRGSHGWLEKIAGGWTISGIMNLHSGFPWTPQYNFQGASDIGNGFDPVYSFGQFAGGSSGNAGNGTYLPVAFQGGFAPDYRSNVPHAGGGSALFTPPTVVPGTLFECLFPNPDPTLCPSGQQGFGPVPTAPGIARNSFRGPGYFGIDATLSKSFGLPNMKVIGENSRIEFRANFYNLFNKLNLNGNPNVWSNGIQADINDAHFGQSQSALGSRVIELQARFSF